jgi:hypothetical protein
VTAGYLHPKLALRLRTLIEEMHEAAKKASLSTDGDVRALHWQEYMKAYNEALQMLPPAVTPL